MLRLQRKESNFALTHLQNKMMTVKYFAASASGRKRITNKKKNSLEKNISSFFSSEPPRNRSEVVRPELPGEGAAAVAGDLFLFSIV